MKIRYWFFSKPTLLVWGCLLSIMTLLASIGLLSLSGWFISSATLAGLSFIMANSFNYPLPSLGVSFFSFVRIIARYGELVVMHEVTFKMLSRLRVLFYQTLEPLAPAHLIRYQSGELLHRMVTDVNALDQLYVRIFTPIVSALAMMAIIYFYVSFFSQDIAFLMFGMLFLSFLFLPILIGLLGKKIGEKQLLLSAQLRVNLVTSIQGLTEILLFNQWGNYYKRIEDISLDLQKTQYKMVCIQGLANALLVFLSGSTLMAVIYMATRLIHEHQLSDVNLALLTLTTLACFEAISPLLLGAQYWGKIKLASDRLSDLSHHKPEVIFPDRSLNLPKHYDIHFNHVDFFYTPGHAVLTDFSLRIAGGKPLVLMGNSGSGKSTIAYLLSRFFDPVNGEIFIGNISLKSFSEQDLRKLITLITQQPHLFNATLRDNLKIANSQANDHDLTVALEQVQLNTWFSRLEQGLDTRLGETGAQLSGGELRRLALARAILHNAPIWILDEPTEGLDQDTEKVFWSAIEPLLQQKTVLIITHRVCPLLSVEILSL